VQYTDDRDGAVWLDGITNHVFVNGIASYMRLRLGQYFAQIGETSEHFERIGQIAEIGNSLVKVPAIDRVNADVFKI